jgi:beta-glucosidase
MAMVKHWAVYNQETNRDTARDNAIVSDRAMQEIYMPQFRAAVQQGHVASTMCGYSMVNGSYACENSAIDRVLNHEFGFPGFIASDWLAVHSTVASARAGLDMEMPFGDYFAGPLVQAAQDAGCPRPRSRRWTGGSSPRCSGSTCSTGPRAGRRARS